MLGTPECAVTTGLFIGWGPGLLPEGNLEPEWLPQFQPPLPPSPPCPPVPHWAMLQEERGRDLEANVGKRERKCKQGSQKEAAVLLPPPPAAFAPSVPSFPTSCHALFTVPSFQVPPPL